MAELPEVFYPEDIPEDDRNFDPIPPGTYTMQVIESKIDDTRTGTGQMLVLTLEIIDGEYTNRRIWDRLNIVNQNPDAQRIAQQALRALCMELEISELKDSEELHFKPFDAKVRIEQDKSGQYGPQNRVRYGSGQANPPAEKAAPEPKGRTAAPPPRNSARAPQKAAPAGRSAKPWAAGKAGKGSRDAPF